MQKLENILKNKSFKITPQRIAILNTMKEYGHIEIDSIYEHIKAIHPSISLATVYKNIAHMQEAGIINELSIPGAKTRYEILWNNHSHFVCQKCGDVQDVDVDSSSIEKEMKNRDFTVKYSSHTFFGYCNKCK